MIIAIDGPAATGKSSTAKAVAEKIGLFKKGDLVLSGEEMEKLSDSELEEKD